MRLFQSGAFARLLVAVLCLAAPVVTGAGVARAQTGAAGQPTAPNVERPDYVLVKDDQIEVTVLNHPEFNRSLVVDPVGNVDYPILGIYKAEGKKLGDLRVAVVKALRKRFVNPQVTVVVRGRPPKFVSVFGSVGNKGKIQYKEDWRVLDVLAASGGIVGAVGGTNRYELYTMTLQRARTGETIQIDPVKLFAGDESQNLKVEENDVLNVYDRPVAELQVQVVGQVKAPNAVPLPASRSIRDVLQLVGNPIPELAKLSASFIRRKGPDGKEQIIDVDLRGYLLEGFEPRLDSAMAFENKRPGYRQGGTGEVLKLSGGDVLVIPENRDRYFLFGRFARGGSIPFPDDRKITLVEAIAESGGQTDGAELKKTRVTRKAPEDAALAKKMTEQGWAKTEGAGGKTPVYTKIVNVEAMLKGGDRKDDFLLQPGDEVWVQGTGARRGIGINEIGIGIGAFSTLYFLLQAFR